MAELLFKKAQKEAETGYRKGILMLKNAGTVSGKP